MKGPTGGVARDLYMLSSFLCLMLSSASMFLIHQSIKDTGRSYVGEVLPSDSSNPMLLWAGLACAALIALISLVAFIGSLIRSPSVVKFGYILTIIIIILEVGVFCLAYYAEGDFQNAAEKMWNKLKVDDRETFERLYQCSGWEGCRQKFMDSTREVHPNLLKYSAIAMLAFQVITVLLGCIVDRKLSKAPVPYRYPTSTQMV
ncbi:unnamed protein product (mitochondrion) [Plasmodiophora brassicae]|uniref:Tetraspanin family protein n=1 Tax=Plasmodiophora brassicae TaxID=37360 RepID=A0A3P3Y946_PLABS|nr:unnamed protein product [Plasmodiophora brassicae]